MANELLDFVMSVVRDPDAAARYAENPQQAIADAHLTDVTSVDVDNLIPVVSESLSMSAPLHGADAAADANVWSSGAATAAFDAFSDHVPGPVPGEVHEPVITAPATSPVDVDAGQWHDPALDLPHVDAGPLNQPFTTTEDVVPPADPGHVDPVFDHPVEHHDFGDDAGPAHDTPLF
jgi:hypothetical protein